MAQENYQPSASTGGIIRDNPMGRGHRHRPRRDTIHDSYNHHLNQNPHCSCKHDSCFKNDDTMMMISKTIRNIPREYYGLDTHGKRNVIMLENKIFQLFNTSYFKDRKMYPMVNSVTIYPALAGQSIGFDIAKSDAALFKRVMFKTFGAFRKNRKVLKLCIDGKPGIEIDWNDQTHCRKRSNSHSPPPPRLQEESPINVSKFSKHKRRNQRGHRRERSSSMSGSGGSDESAARQYGSYEYSGRGFAIGHGGGHNNRGNGSNLWESDDSRDRSDSRDSRDSTDSIELGDGRAVNDNKYGKNRKIGHERKQSQERGTRTGNGRNSFASNNNNKNHNRRYSKKQGAGGGRAHRRQRSGSVSGSDNSRRGGGDRTGYGRSGGGTRGKQSVRGDRDRNRNRNVLRDEEKGGDGDDGSRGDRKRRGGRRSGGGRGATPSERDEYNGEYYTNRNDRNGDGASTGKRHDRDISISPSQVPRSKRRKLSQRASSVMGRCGGSSFELKYYNENERRLMKQSNKNNNNDRRSYKDRRMSGSKYDKLRDDRDEDSPPPRFNFTLNEFSDENVSPSPRSGSARGGGSGRGRGGSRGRNRNRDRSSGYGSRYAHGHEHEQDRKERQGRKARSLMKEKKEKRKKRISIKETRLHMRNGNDNNSSDNVSDYYHSQNIGSSSDEHVQGRRKHNKSARSGRGSPTQYGRRSGTRYGNNGEYDSYRNNGVDYLQSHRSRKNESSDDNPSFSNRGSKDRESRQKRIENDYLCGNSSESNGSRYNQEESYLSSDNNNNNNNKNSSSVSRNDKNKRKSKNKNDIGLMHLLDVPNNGNKENSGSSSDFSNFSDMSNLSNASSNGSFYGFTKNGKQKTRELKNEYVNERAYIYDDRSHGSSESDHELRHDHEDEKNGDDKLMLNLTKDMSKCQLNTIDELKNSIRKKTEIEAATSPQEEDDDDDDVTGVKQRYSSSSSSSNSNSGSHNQGNVEMAV